MKRFSVEALTVGRWMRGILPLVIFLVISGCDSSDPNRRRVGIDTFVDVSRDEQAVCGELALTVIYPTTRASESVQSTVFSSIFRRGADYAGMEDNDIRGYLDGAFKEGWNQVSQSHLRLGRRGRNPAYGEYELFRNLHRWADLPIPRTAEIMATELRLTLESGPDYAVDVAVYAVHKDWNPGNGGTNKDNNSPPETGEVWWLDAKSGETPWAKPGVSHASDSDSNADTGAQPLAVARYLPGKSEQLVFNSEGLTHYIDSRIKAQKPVLLLYKLVDVYEDSLGSVFEIWSGNYGVDGSSRRPTLQIQWRAATGESGARYSLALEHGRALEFFDITVGGRKLLATKFVADPDMLNSMGPPLCGQVPFVEYRTSGSHEPWRSLTVPVEVNVEKIDIRVSAAEKPVALGEKYVSEIRDTWIPYGAPEEHVVWWRFETPDGRVVEQAGEYVGDYTWKVSVNTDAIGRWRYRWRHELSGSPLQSEEHQFDVVAWEQPRVLLGLQSLSTAIQASGARPRSHEMLPFELRFMRLQRAASAVLSGRLPPSSGDTALLAEARHTRELLSGRSVPETIKPRPITSREATEPADQGR